MHGLASPTVISMGTLVRAQLLIQAPDRVPRLYPLLHHAQTRAAPSATRRPMPIASLQSSVKSEHCLYGPG